MNVKCFEPRAESDCGYCWVFLGVFFGLFTVVFSVSDSSSSQRSYRFVALGCHQGQETNIWCPVWQVCVRTCVCAVCWMEVNPGSGVICHRWNPTPFQGSGTGERFKAAGNLLAPGGTPPSPRSVPSLSPPPTLPLAILPSSAYLTISPLPPAPPRLIKPHKTTALPLCH